MDYVLNPLICTILCSKFAMNFFPEIPYAAWVVCLRRSVHLLEYAGHSDFGANQLDSGCRHGRGHSAVSWRPRLATFMQRLMTESAIFTRPFFDPKTFSVRAIMGGTSLAVLTYIGFDGISTLSEEAKNPRRNILLATVFVCLLTGLVGIHRGLCGPTHLARRRRIFLTWTRLLCLLPARAGGRWLFLLINVTLLVATVGSALGAQLGAARLLYGMGRSSALAAQFFWGDRAQEAHSAKQRVACRRSCTDRCDGSEF